MHRFRLVIALLASLALMPAASSAAPAKPPFRLPFAIPPGPDTWLVGQMYGNTTSAYFQRFTTYKNGQGLHFGIDFSAPCGTPVVAIGDGIVYQADGPFGAAPHNLMIDHPNGYSSLYGHLLEKPKLERGQPVRAGEVIGLTGDSYGTCRSAPHLHLEIRSLDGKRAFNPVPLIDADWDSLLLMGSGGPIFERDLLDPRRWQRIDDQPDTRFYGLIINDYDNPWPPDIRR